MADANIKQFRARWSIALWVMTLFIAALVLCLLIFGLPAPGALLAVILCVCIPYVPRAFYISEHNLTVNRLGPDVVIRVNDIQGIRRVHRKDFGLTIRIFGVGGFFGYYGHYYSFRIGKFKAYATNLKSLVLITCDDRKKYVLSPENADEFTDMVSQLKEAS